MLEPVGVNLTFLINLNRITEEVVFLFFINFLYFYFNFVLSHTNLKPIYNLQMFIKSFNTFEFNYRWKQNFMIWKC